METNNDKMREALEAVIKVGYPHNFQREAPHIREYCYDITRAIKKCFAALSAPPRNCDRFKTRDEAIQYYNNHAKKTHEAWATWNVDGVEYFDCADWLFAEAKE